MVTYGAHSSPAGYMLTALRKTKRSREYIRLADGLLFELHSRDSFDALLVDPLQPGRRYKNTIERSLSYTCRLKKPCTLSVASRANFMFESAM